MKIGGALSNLGGLLVGSSAKSAAIEAAKWVATKALLLFLLTTVLAVVLNNFVIDWISDYLAAAVAELSGDTALNSAVIQLTGVGSYLAAQFRLQESFSVMLAGLSVGAIRSFIPFL